MRLLFRVLLMAAIALYAVMALWSFPLIAENAGGLAGFDLRFFGYSADEARAFLSALSDTGRAHYLGIQHSLDLVYPAVLSLTLVLGVLRFGARLPLVVRLVLVLIPLAGAGADYVENVLVAEILTLPVADVTDAMIAQASLVTTLKSMLFAVAIGVTFLLAVVFALRRRRNIKRRAKREAKF
jgi:glucan phosphoethanolaminetransferase (alkaline phosphatase superfamily)